MKVLFISLLCVLTLGSCRKDDIVAVGRTFSLLNQENKDVRFPDDFRGKPMVVSFLYTNCPTVCVVTTHRMALLRTELGDRDDVMFVSISLDPRRDRPGVLNDFARLRGIDTESWQFLTGSIGTIDSLCEGMNVYAQRSFIEKNENGTEYYTIDHSDVIAIVDRNGVIRERYTGTELDVEKAVAEINELL